MWTLVKIKDKGKGVKVKVPLYRPRQGLRVPGV